MLRVTFIHIVPVVVILVILFYGFEYFPTKILGLSQIIIYNDEDVKKIPVNNVLMWVGTNNDNIGADTTNVSTDSSDGANGSKACIHWHVADGPNPQLTLGLYDPSYNQPLDAANTGRVTFWIKAKSGSPPLWFWAEDASYSGEAGQSSRINISGSRIFTQNKAIVNEDWNGQWQFVSLSWSLLESKDTAFVSQTFPLSWTRTDNNFNRSIIRQLKFDSRAYPYADSRPPVGQGYIADYYIDEIQFLPDLVTNINKEENIPTTFSLHQNFPNPFNPTTQISYDIPSNINVSLEIFDIMGRKVRNLIEDQFVKPGSYTVQWDGKDNKGQFVASGTYIYSIQAGHFVSAKKMTLIK